MLLPFKKKKKNNLKHRQHFESYPFKSCSSIIDLIEFIIKRICIYILYFQQGFLDKVSRQSQI